MRRMITEKQVKSFENTEKKFQNVGIAYPDGEAVLFYPVNYDQIALGADSGDTGSGVLYIDQEESLVFHTGNLYSNANSHEIKLGDYEGQDSWKILINQDNGIQVGNDHSGIKFDGEEKLTIAGNSIEIDPDVNGTDQRFVVCDGRLVVAVTGVHLTANTEGEQVNLSSSDADGNTTGQIILDKNGISVEGDVDTTGSGYIKLLNLPTSDPHVAGALWNDNGTLKISAGV